MKLTDSKIFQIFITISKQLKPLPHPPHPTHTNINKGLTKIVLVFASYKKKLNDDDINAQAQ